MAVFLEEVIVQARKGAARDGKRKQGVSRKGAKFDAKTQRKTLRASLSFVALRETIACAGRGEY
jgi:hypothetical protein